MAPIAVSSLSQPSSGTTLKATATPFHPTETPHPKYHAASSDEATQAEATYAAHNYHPLPIVFARASGCNVWDPEGRCYLDFVSIILSVVRRRAHGLTCDGSSLHTAPSTKAIVIPNWSKP